MSGARWIIHLPTTTIDRSVAVALATTLRAELDHVEVIDFGETTVSEEDRQFLRTRVWCDTRLPGGAGRCALADGHPGDCTALPR
ncbi:hypothetical protein [Micromonospora echinofusca]|uniref:Uncharacterized protein n=1 Tax=Micromonospora echinofusca TaxID=47858 RepID=A0ABS3VXM8_MICEH|nr:hypothetical protein [Micromonospora echinofusca]MBO4209119.1 hypothetical protein [Micromonospora echinofusca]